MSAAARGDRGLGRLLATPAALLLGAVALLPILAAAFMSLERIVLVFHERRFVGLANYEALLADGRFLSALGRTLGFTAAAVSLELLLGLPLALVLHGVRRGRGLLRVAVLVPWTMPTAVSAKLWAWLLNPSYGLVDRLWPGPPRNWLGEPGLALLAAIAVDVWKTTPFVALILLAGLQAVPDELHQAARIEGASGFRILARITLPLLRPALLVALLFRSFDAFRVFDAIYVLTQGGPAQSTETLSIYAYKTLMRAGDFGYGSTLSVATFLCMLALAALYLGALGRGAEPGS